MKDCTIYNCIGLFFSTFLPGGLSGDAVRVFYFWKNKNSIESDKSAKQKKPKEKKTKQK